jgi:hypothetical protein
MKTTTTNTDKGASLITENHHFSGEQIETLRAQFAGLAAVNPDRLPEFRRVFASCTNEALLQLAKSGIKFLSKLAINACVRRGIAP